MLKLTDEQDPLEFEKKNCLWHWYLHLDQVNIWQHPGDLPCGEMKHNSHSKIYVLDIIHIIIMHTLSPYINTTDIKVDLSLDPNPMDGKAYRHWNHCSNAANMWPETHNKIMFLTPYVTNIWLLAHWFWKAIFMCSEITL